MVQFSSLDPAAAIALLLERLESVDLEKVAIESAAGRVLGSPLRLDRDSPACDVSAMDGYAVRIAELNAGPVPLVGECHIGESPATLATGSALRIYTGCPVPQGADTVVRLEHAEVLDEQLQLHVDRQPTQGADIRRQGENSKQGEGVLEQGALLTPAAVSAAASIGATSLVVHRPLTITVLTTGNELVDATDDALEELPAWRLRDSNGPALVAMLSGIPWIAKVVHQRVPDSLELLTEHLAKAVAASDAVVLTGGVSKGAYDFVSDAITGIGGEVVFHGVMARPGRPTLGAVAEGVPVLGLPGNPLAVLTTGRRMLVPTLQHLAGCASSSEPLMPVVTLDAWQGKTIPLSWWRPVRLTGAGTATLVSLRGSGDVCGPAQSDGFVEVRPDSNSVGPHPFYSWVP